MFVKHAVDSAFSEETSVMSLQGELRKPNCSNKLCFPLILILIIFYIFERGGELIFES